MAYTEKEIESFRKKDILYSRFAALKASATLYDGVGCDLGHTTDTVLADADKYYRWLRQDQDLFVTGKDGSTIVGEQTDEVVGVGSRAPENQLPEPTLAQKTVIDAIVAKLGWKQSSPLLKTRILDWAEETHGQRSYPTKLNSVDTFLKWFNN